ncbi:MAG: toll/interleukin-1 receptor domain-containing protein [Anaerolineales bacterium]|nr:toll/interleukin-1 receptor domain-containing protein [Anaerolineales bacterium]
MIQNGLALKDVSRSLQRYKKLRDSVLHEDVVELDHHLRRAMEFCGSDFLTKSILEPVCNSNEVSSSTWWQQIEQNRSFRGDTQAIEFPSDVDEELALRYSILKDAVDSPRKITHLGFSLGETKGSAAKQRFLSIVARPFFDELSERLGEAAKQASPEVRALQGLPYNRIPAQNETKIFLSHKSQDKPLVNRYYKILSEIGFQPWLDNPAMPAGSLLERSLYKGLEDSCAAVFFITDNFVDEHYLAKEVDYAIEQKDAKGDKFAIITLVFSETQQIPKLLRRYVYKVIQHEIDGLYEIIRALPIELGPIRWKEKIS